MLDKSQARAYSAPVAGFWARRNFWNGLGGALAALAVVLQALVPQGFMPGQAQAGPALVICTGHGPLKASDLDGGKAPAGDRHSVCAFAGHGAAPVLGAALSLAPVRVSYLAVASIPESVHGPAVELAAPPPPATGPPSQA